MSKPDLRKVLKTLAALQERELQEARAQHGLTLQRLQEAEAAVSREAAAWSATVELRGRAFDLAVESGGDGIKLKRALRGKARDQAKNAELEAAKRVTEGLTERRRYEKLAENLARKACKQAEKRATTELDELIGQRGGRR